MIKCKVLVKSPPWPEEEVDRFREKVLKIIPSSLFPEVSTHPDLPGRVVLSMSGIKEEIKEYLKKLEEPIEDIVWNGEETEGNN